VNGSDPELQKDMAKYSGNFTPDDAGKGRYRDYGTLRFSLRSIEKFAPWVRMIHIVTNGQVPSWFVKENGGKAVIVTHRQIFENVSDLPTFNSNSIEVNLRNIPGLADCYIYLNDDFFLGRETPKDHFFNLTNGNIKLCKSK